MFGARWQVLRLFGIPLYLDASWLIILALLTMTLTALFPQLLQDFYPDSPALTTGSYLVMALIAALAFFGCVVLHELGHAIVGRRQKMPIRGITLFMFGGVAEIGDEPPSGKAELLMAIAGPAVSVVLALVCGVAAWLGYQQGWPPPLVVVLGYLAAINTLVLVFNMIPAFPLDGGRVLRSLLWIATGNLRRSTFWSALAGRFFAWLLIGYGIINFFQGNWFGGIWFGLLGLFLSNAAQMGYQQVLIRQALQGERVERFMNPDPVTVPPHVDLRQWVEDYVYHYHRKLFPVVEDGRLRGWIDTRVLAELPRGEWAQHTVGEVMHRDLSDVSIAPQADAMKALGKMQRSGLSRLLVVEGERLVGILSLKDLLRFLNLKMELEGLEENPHAAAERGRRERREAEPVEAFGRRA